MGTPVRFTPLLGAQSEAPLCSLLEVGGIRFLIDCGWDDSFDVRLLEPVIRYALHLAICRKSSGMRCRYMHCRLSSLLV